ncbi:DUF2975 domain-containing protein [Rhizomicrobium electricum]|uniref:DUF2975 domain-containing protein n=1 Tax=Rhizomicrobium electricum TaxID=480070 RepID=A0ABN1F802_9PROT|nr:DUF2975 domain-containing protein [Rhizomicrobium electricum]NIJ46739.1 hypothetical protein [Rhizomicrobium electricum]
MKDTRWIARLLKWLFVVCVVGCIIGTVAVVLVMVIDPKLSMLGGNANFNFDMLGQGGTVTLTNKTAMADWMRGNVHVQVNDANGLFEVIKHHGLPLALMFTLFYAVLFDLLRRLFRNVVRGDSFTRNTLRLVQVIGLALVVFSFVSAAAEGWFYFAVTDFLTHHATATLAGSPVPMSGNTVAFDDHGGGLFNSLFLTGLLVLALSEVFRQGLVLKNEHDLTV